MAENIASKEVAPLIEKAELDLEAATTGPEIQVDANATSTQGRKIGDFLADRTTYYCERTATVANAIAWHFFLLWR